MCTCAYRKVYTCVAIAINVRARVAGQHRLAVPRGPAAIIRIRIIIRRRRRS